MFLSAGDRLSVPGPVRSDVPKVWIACLSLLAAVSGAALVSDTAFQGQDFDVFWRAGRRLLEGAPLYGALQDGPMLFKYPPWTAAVFVPLSLIPLVFARWVWGIVQLLSLAYLARWVMRQGVSLWSMVVCVGFFWGIWAVHFLDGQVEIPCLAAVLWASELETRSRTLAWGFALSAKVFTMIAAFGWRERVSLRVGVWLVVGATIFVLPALWSQPEHSVSGLFRDWFRSASSAGVLFDPTKVRGRDNQGFPALLLRLYRVPAAQSLWDIELSILFSAAFGGFWARRSRAMTAVRRRAGWLAIAPICHPLAWFHLFVWVFPLFALVSDDVFHRRISRRRTLFTVFGLLLLTVVTRRTLGGLGETLELASVKSWGVAVLLACA